MYHPAGMRRAGPAIILLIGALALIINFFPGLRLPDGSAPEGAWRLIETKLGLDLEGGLRVEYQALAKDDVLPDPEAMGVIKDIIERRVNTTGVSEPVVVTQGSDRVVIELPGVSDVDSVRRLVGQTGQLDFVPLGPTPASAGQVLPPLGAAGQPSPLVMEDLRQSDANPLDLQAIKIAQTAQQQLRQPVAEGQAGQRLVPRQLTN